MKTKIVLASVFAALSGLAGVANTAKAGSDIHINAFFGARPAPVMVAPFYRGPVAPVVIEHRREEPRGYWKDVAVKTWVPARWIVSRDYRGRPVRHYEAGYFAYSTNRIWVDAGRGDLYCRD